MGFLQPERKDKQVMANQISGSEQESKITGDEHQVTETFGKNMKS